MAPILNTQASKLSTLTLSTLRAMGWYNISNGVAEDMSFGYNAGWY